MEVLPGSGLVGAGSSKHVLRCKPGRGGEHGKLPLVEGAAVNLANMANNGTSCAIPDRSPPFLPAPPGLGGVGSRHGKRFKGKGPCGCKALLGNCFVLLWFVFLVYDSAIWPAILL